MKGIGCDLVEIERIEEAVKNHGQSFKDKIFTKNEQAYCDGKKHASQHYAVRFAAKEAVAKALGCGFGEFLKFLDVEVVLDEKGKPHIALSDEANKIHNNPKLLISLSHSKGLAQAVAVWD